MLHAFEDTARAEALIWAMGEEIGSKERRAMIL